MVTWTDATRIADGAEEPDICARATGAQPHRGMIEPLDDVAQSLRCVAYWILPSALLGAIATIIGLAWLAHQWIGG